MNVMRSVPRFLGVAVALLGGAGMTMAQVSIRSPGQEINVSGGEVSIRSDGGAPVVSGNGAARADSVTSIATGGSEASVNVGGIGSQVDVQGVAVVNGKVYIDNKEIPPGVTRYKSPRTGTVYLIQRRGGAVSVSSEGGAK